MKASITKWLKERLKLKVNEAKSAAARFSRRMFLGYAMTWNRVPKLKPAEKSVERFKGKVRALFRKGRGRNVERFIKEDLNPVLRGWAEYYKLSHVKVVFEDLDSLDTTQTQMSYLASVEAAEHAIPKTPKVRTVGSHSQNLGRKRSRAMVELGPRAPGHPVLEAIL